MSRRRLALLAALLLFACGLSPALAQTTARPAAPAYGEPPQPVPGLSGGPAPAQPAGGQGDVSPDSPELRRRVSDAHVLSAAATCFYGPHIDQGQAKRLCGQQARGKLLDAAAVQFGNDPSIVRAGLSPRSTSCARGGSSARPRSRPTTGRCRAAKCVPQARRPRPR